MNLAHFFGSSPMRNSMPREASEDAATTLRSLWLCGVLGCSLLAFASATHADQSSKFSALEVSRPLLTALPGKAPASQITFDATKIPTIIGEKQEFPFSTRLTSLSATSMARSRKRASVSRVATIGQAKPTFDAPSASAFRRSLHPAIAERNASTNTRIARVDAPVASLPPAGLLPRVLQNASKSQDFSISSLPEMSASSKVVQVQALKLPPVSQPLPKWMQDVTIPIDQNFVSVPLPAKPNSQPAAGAPRSAQNPDAPPVRQPQRPITSSDFLPNQIEVATSTYLVLVTRVDLQTVAIADPNVADVTVVNARALLVNGKAPGVTTLVVVDRVGVIRQYQVRVVPAPGGRPNDIAALIGIEGVGVRQVRDTIILEGEVENAEEMQRAIEMAGIFSERVINQLKVRGKEDPSAVTALQIQEALNRPDISVRVVNDTTILDGTVANARERQRAEQIARTYAEEVLNLLQLPALSIEEVREMLGAADAAPAAPEDYIGLAGQLRAPAGLVVRQSGDQIVLEGALRSQADVDSALAAAARTGLPVISRLTVAPEARPEAVLLQTIAQAIGIPGVRVRGTTKRLVLEGVVADTNVAVTAEQIARGFADEVDNQLQTPNPILVDVDVSFVEISTDNLRRLGFEIPALQDASASGFVVGQRSLSYDLPGPLGPTDPDSPVSPPLRAMGTQSAFQLQLRAEATRGNARILSNPRTLVLSGRTATFQVGGQVPIPVSVTQSATGTTTAIEFKNFGILLDVIPNANANGVLTMRLRTEVSEPDFSIGFTPFPGATAIPGFNRRASVTEVTVGPDSTLALGGLISNVTRKTVTKIPVLSSIPILGKLFTSKRFQNEQTELIIFVTPRVRTTQLAPGETAPAAVTAAGNTTNVGARLGNPGIASFDEGVSIIPAN